MYHRSNIPIQKFPIPAVEKMAPAVAAISISRNSIYNNRSHYVF